MYEHMSRKGEVRFGSTFIYQAEIYCVECGHDIAKDLDKQGKSPENPSDHHSYDSDDYPKGPNDSNSHQVDSPQHCAHCGIYLDLPLTSDGREYVIEALRSWVAEHDGDAEVLDLWLDSINFKGILDKNQDFVVAAYERIRDIQKTLIEVAENA